MLAKVKQALFITFLFPHNKYVDQTACSNLKTAIHLQNLKLKHQSEGSVLVQILVRQVLFFIVQHGSGPKIFLNLKSNFGLASENVLGLEDLFLN